MIDSAIITSIYTSRYRLHLNSVIKQMLQWLVILLTTLLSTHVALAHQSSTAYLALPSQDQPTNLTVEYRLAIRDLALLAPLDVDNNRQITWGEIRQQQPAIVQILNQGLQWRSGQQLCQANVLQQPFAIDRIAGMSYLVAYIGIDCGQQSLKSLNYQVLAHIDSGHRLIVSTRQAVSDASRTWLVANGETALYQSNFSWTDTLKTYVKEGLHHILTGYDHLLFLLCLLLPSVYSRQQRQWILVQSAGTAIKHIVYIATAFTLAHSITLSLAALHIVSVPARIIESVIAFSIALAALNNLVPIFGSKHVRIAFFFGLVHGFGFANVLSDLPLDIKSKILALFSFNLGIELGQLACILVFLPIALMLRHTRFYRHVLFQGGSVAACILALLWMIQRIFDLNWIAG